MPNNISEAIAALDAAETTSAETAEETEVGQSSSEDTSADTEVSAKTGKPKADEATDAEKPAEEELDEAALRKAKLKEQLEAAKAKKERALAQSKFKAEVAEFQRAKEQLVSFQTQLKEQFEAHQRQVKDFETQRAQFFADLRKNPVATFRAAGVAPDVAYELISNEVLKRETPEAKEAALQDQLLERIRKEFEPKLSKAEELEKKIAEYEARERQRQELEASANNQAAASEFLRIVHGSGHEDLADYYDDDQLIHLGDTVAREFLAEGRRYTLDDVAKELAERHASLLRRGQERRQRRTAGSQSAAIQPASTPNTGTAPKKPATTAIGNDIASASATSAAKPKSRSRKEILDEAARDIESADIVSMFR